MRGRDRLRRLPWEIRYKHGERLMSALRIAVVRSTYTHCRVEFRGPARLGPGFHLDIRDGGTFIAGAGVDFRRGFVCEIWGNGRVVIGDDTVFTSHALLQCTTSIEIGKRCAFGQSTLIVDGKHRYLGTDSHWLDQGYDFQPVTIGDGVGVSDKCTVQNSIGERSMIVSHSVVNREIPPYSLAAGVPARVIRRFGPDESAGAGPVVPAAEQ
jgi:acetyltransferase-like isoleucine patch superfamily enzyme